MALPLTPRDQATYHLQELNGICPGLTEPHKGALQYALQTASNPHLDTQICKTMGKVVIITANLFQALPGKIGLRGEKGPLSWQEDFPADERVSTEDSNYVRFLLHIPPKAMNETLEFKLFTGGKWQRGSNNFIDLSRYGHIVWIEFLATF